MSIRHIILLAFCLLAIPLPLLAATDLATEDEEAYYYVGEMNQWSTEDLSFPLVKQADGVTWEITIPAPGNDRGWFKIAPASAYGQSNFWHLLLCAPYDGCRELSGTMYYNGGAWLLPNEDGIDSYTLRIVPSTMQYELVPHEAVSTPWSGSLPVIFINTQEPVTSKETYVTGTYYIDALGLEDYESIGSAEKPLALQIRGRGNFTWNAFDKKPYRLKFDKKAQPLGMNKSKHFTLLAHADDDMAFLRNTVGFELSRRLGLAYTPEQRPIEVVLNGDYIGLYMLTEQIRVDGDRVNITEQNDNETDPENITGGWLLEIDNYDDPYQIRMTEGNGALLRFTFHSPEILSDAQKSYISDYLQNTDNAIYASDKSSTLWEDYIDMDALVRFYLIQEITDNGESFHGSCYLHKDRGSNTKLVFGPVWDFGNSFRRSLDNFIYVNSPFGQSWIGEIARFPRFQEAVQQRWQTFLAYDYDSLDDFIDAFVAKISAASACDDKRWPQYSQDNIIDRRDWFKSNLHQKVDWLCEQWGKPTGIKEIERLRNGENDGEHQSSGIIYDLQGRRIANSQLLNGRLQKGLYIRNGRKVVSR